MNRWNEKLDELYDESLTVGYEGDKNYNHITKYLRDEARSYHIQLSQIDRYNYSKIVDELYPQKNKWGIDYKDNDNFQVIHQRVRKFARGK